MQITVDDLLNVFNPEIIDIRDSLSYNKGHILNAYNISFNNLLIYPNKYLKKDKIYYIYCQKGYRSNYLCQILNAKNFQVCNILGGYEAWIDGITNHNTL